MIDNSGISPSELSRRLHKSRTYINTLRRQESAPSLPTFARLAHECGYKLKLERADGKQIELYNEDDADEFRDTEIGPTADDEDLKALEDVRAAYSSDTDSLKTVTEEEWEWMQTDVDTPRFKELYNLIISHAENPERKRMELDRQIEEWHRPVSDDVREKLRRLKEDPEYRCQIEKAMDMRWESRKRERRKRMEEEEDFFKAQGATNPSDRP